MSFKTESFYDWCQRTGNQSFLLRWDDELNDKKPNEVSKSDINFYYFKCEAGLHPSEPHQINSITRYCKIPKCSVCNSFGFWCDTNNRKDLMDRWDYELNNCSPYEVSISTLKKYYFKCPKGIHPSEPKDLNNIRKQFGSGQCIQCNSFGQWGIDNFGENFIKDYWSDLNTEDPMFISRRTPKKYFIKCQKKDYHPDYEISCANFVAGKRCPCCAGKKVHILDSLGYLYPESFEFWFEKKTSPYDYLPQSNKSVYWNCKKHGLFKRKIFDMVRSDFMCPKCRREQHDSILQRKVNKYITSIFDDVRHEFDCSITPINPETNYRLPYDNEIVDIKLIIEVNGEQHYKVNSYFFSKDLDVAKKQLAHRKQLDKIKKQYALNNGYSFLEIPYWTDDKKQTWKKLIDDKIASIVT